jgi:hypothetical protein
MRHEFVRIKLGDSILKFFPQKSIKVKKFGQTSVFPTVIYEVIMSKLTESLKKAGIPAEVAVEIDSELFEIFVARENFPPLKWEKEVLMPIQLEQFKASERLETLRSDLRSFRQEVDARFQSNDSRFQAIDEKFKIMMWMQGLIIALVFAIFSKMYLGV